MSKARVAVLKVVTKELSVTAAAAKYGYSRQHLHRLLARYKIGGIEAVDPRPRKPLSNPAATPAPTRERIIELRLHLTRQGWDAGPITLAWHLEQEGHRPPSTSTIRRILHAAGLITPEPRKRPRSSYRRFAAAQPNQTWQSDFTHWRLADGTDVEILNWLDDHARYLLSCTAHTPVTGDDVTATFLTAAEENGYPASTLTDNGRVYTARFGGGHNAFEYLLALLGITQKNGAPGHPQTQGKVERFHQTLKKHLAEQPPAATIAELQDQLDRFRDYYNHQRPHRELGRNTPANTYTSLPKAEPNGDHRPGHYRLRYNRLDKDGKMSFRRAGRMHHIGVGSEHARTQVHKPVDGLHIRIVNAATGELLRELTLNPSRDYQPLGRPPGPQPKTKKPGPSSGSGPSGIS